MACDAPSILLHIIGTLSSTQTLLHTFLPCIFDQALDEVGRGLADNRSDVTVVLGEANAKFLDQWDHLG